MFIGPFEHHSNELPWRESIADVVVIPRGRRRPHRPERPRAASWSRYADRPLKIGSFSARQQRHRHPQRHRRHRRRCCTAHGALSFWDFAAAGAVRRIEMDGDVANDPLRTRTRSSSARTSSSAGPSTPGVLVVRRELLTNRVPDVPGGGTVAYVNPDRAPLPRRPGAARGGRHARRSSSRSAPAWCSSSRRPSASTSIRAHEDALPAPRGRGVARPSRRSRSSATSTPSGCRSSRSSSARRAGRYLHHNFVVALLNDLFGIQSRGGCSCAGPYGHRLLGIDLEPLARVRARDRRAAARASSPAGCGSTSTTSSPRRSFDYIVEAVAAGRASTAGGCCPTTGSTPPPGCGTTATARSSRRCG